MFKYLFLKSLYDLSDVDLVERSRTDLAFKYFFDMTPEKAVIDPSSLTKFRKQRLRKTVEIAIEKGVVQSKTLIVDSTHTKARYNLLSLHDALFGRANQLRRKICTVHGIKAEELPERPQADSSVTKVFPTARCFLPLYRPIRG